LYGFIADTPSFFVSKSTILFLIKIKDVTSFFVSAVLIVCKEQHDSMMQCCRSVPIAELNPDTTLHFVANPDHDLDPAPTQSVTHVGKPWMPIVIRQSDADSILSGSTTLVS
jgi:hypothetical protein